MNSFRRSRGRVSLEIFCALTISLSLAGAWQQTGAWALLPASLASLVCAMILAADLKGRAATTAPLAEPQRIDFDSSLARDSAELDEGAPAVVADEKEAPEPETRAAPRSRAARNNGSGRARKGRGPKKAVAAAAAPEETASLPLAPEPVTAKEAAHAALEEPTPLFADEPQHPPVAPLFEPEPFVRQQRAVFGRKAG